jgi:thioredoxin-related protein
MKKGYKNSLLIFLSLMIVNIMILNAQDKKPAIYNVNADAKSDLKIALDKAGKEGKNVLIQVGGNWCKWCIKFHEFITKDSQIDSLINADYVYILINYSKENRNLEMMKQLEYPQRFGFPVLVILDSKGKRLHTQDSGFLESGTDSYSREKIITFLKCWNTMALDPKNYLTK